MWGLPPALKRLLPSADAVRALPLASTALLNRATWRRGRASQEARSFLDVNKQGPRDFLLLHRICAYSGGQAHAALEPSAVHTDSAGFSDAIASFLSSSSAAFAALFSQGVPGVSRPLDASPDSLDAALLGERLLASLAAAPAPAPAPGAARARVARVTTARVVDCFSVWEDVSASRGEGQAEEGRGGWEGGAQAWRGRGAAHARGRSVVLTAAKPLKGAFMSFLQKWWHEHTLRPARSAAALVSVAYVCEEEGAEGGAAREAVHVGVWECALAAPPRPALFQALPFLSYLIEAPLTLSQGWRLVSWDGVDPATLHYAAPQAPLPPPPASAPSAPSAPHTASTGGLALPLPSSLPLLRLAGELATASATARMRASVESALALAGVWDTEVCGQWCGELKGSMDALLVALEGSEGGQRLLRSSIAAAQGKEGGALASAAGVQEDSEGRDPPDALRAHFALVSRMFEEARTASEDMAQVRRVTPWARRVDAELAAEALFWRGEVGAGEGEGGAAAAAAAAAPHPTQAAALPHACPTSEQVQLVLDLGKKSTPLLMWFYLHSGGRDKLAALFGELAVRFIDSRFYLLVGAVGLNTLVKCVVEEGERQGCRVGGEKEGAGGGKGEGEEEEEEREGRGGRGKQQPAPATLADVFDDELREFLVTITWERDLTQFEDGGGEEEEEQEQGRGRRRRAAERQLAEGRKEVREREMEAVKRLNRVLGRVVALGKELK